MTGSVSDPGRFPDLLPADLRGVIVNVVLAKRTGGVDSDVVSFSEGDGEGFRHFWAECCHIFGNDPERRIIAGVQRHTPMSTIGGSAYVRASFIIVEDGEARSLSRAEIRGLIVNDPQDAETIIPDEFQPFSG